MEPSITAQWAADAAAKAGQPAAPLATSKNITQQWANAAASIAGGVNPVNNPSFSKNVLLGLGKGLNDTAVGADQAFNAIASPINAWVGAKLGNTGLGRYETSAATHEAATAKSLGISNKADSDLYAKTPAGQSFASKIGEFGGQALPFLLSPEVSVEGGLLKTLGVKALNDAAIGTATGAIQPVAPGQSRLTNAVAYGVGAPLLGTAGRGIGALLRGASHLIPPLGRAFEKGEVANLLSKSGVPQTLPTSDAQTIPGFNPTLGGLLKNPNIANTERALMQDPRFAGTFNQRAADNQAAILKSIGGLGDTSAPLPEASAAIGKTVSDIKDAAKEQENALWNDKDFLSSPVNITQLKGGLENWKNTLPISDRNKLPQWPFNDLDQIVKEKGPTAPLLEVKALRSNVLRAARGLQNSDPPQAAQLTDFAHELLNNLGTGNGFTATENEAGQALQKASNFTRTMHENLEPLKPAIKTAGVAESKVGPWMMNLSNPVPERVDQYLNAAQQYLGNSTQAPDAARNYFSNLLARAIKPSVENKAIPAGRLEDLLSKNQPIINKLYPDKARQQLISNILDAAKTAEYVPSQKVQDMGSDTAGKLLSHMWLSKNLGEGFHSGNFIGSMVGHVMELPEKSRQAILADALLNPSKAAMLVRKANPANLGWLQRTYKLAPSIVRKAIPAYGAVASGKTLQP